MEEGDVMKIHDRLTGFDDNKPDRPYCVVRVVGDPWTELFVVPRTTRRAPGAVETPANVIAGLNKCGWFLFRGYRLEQADLVDVEPLGRLPHQYLTRIQDLANLAEFDID